MYAPHAAQVVEDEPDAFMRQTGALADIVTQAVAVGLRSAWSSRMIMVVIRHQDDRVYIRGLLPLRFAFMDATGLRRLVVSTVERVHPYAMVTDFRSNVRLQFFETTFRVGVARA